MSVSSTLSERARAAMSSKGCAAAMALVPLAAPMIFPTRAKATVLFGFDSITVQNGSPIDGTGYGPAFPAELYSFTATQLPNGAAHITGSFGAVDPSDFGDYGGTIGFHLQGQMGGTLLAGDPIHGSVEFNVTATGGTVTFLGMQLNTSAGLFAFDYNPEVITGTMSRLISTDASPGEVSFTEVSGFWSLDFAIVWNDYGPTDTLLITVPNDSIDIWAGPVPEPGAFATLVLPASILLMRRRTRARVADDVQASGVVRL